jgi:UDP-N-acetylglucosamine--N-acetylmuramyl-(pentapeptide) pyrophosphoryl-undecaprenol N-acetylglucosamine transferase
MTILFAGGGTGGHLYPAIAIAEEIKKIEPNVRIAFVGTKKKIEARIVPQKGFEFFPIWISGFKRRMQIGNVLFPLKVIVSLFQSFFLILRLKPNAVIGTGGYVCGPILSIASLMKVPTVIHESNSFPGVTTRLVASKATKVFITFAETKKWLSSKANVELVGNPTRDELTKATRSEAFKFFNLSPDKKTVFAFGGSLGAASINKAMPQVVKDAIDNDYQVLWQTGESEAQSGITIQHHPNIVVLKYIDRMDFGYAVADVIVSRSGASTLAEITRLGKPAILVPYPLAAANHQELNARTMMDAGAAIMIKDSDMKDTLFGELKSLLFDSERQQRMREKSVRLGKPNAGKEIAEKIMHLVR